MKKQTTTQEGSGIGLVLRTFATQEKHIEARMAMLKEMTDRVHMINKDAGKKVIERVDIMVWNDQTYFDYFDHREIPAADCGKSYDALRDAYKDDDIIHIHDVTSGDLYCGCLNEAISIQQVAGMHYSLIASPNVYEYMTTKNIAALLAAIENGAKVTGLAIDELHDSVLEGRITNTFALWDVPSLISVGCFNPIARKPKNVQSSHHLVGYSPLEKNDHYFPINGVEEIIPLLFLVEKYGQCIAPIEPVDGGTYQLKDKEGNEAALQLHIQKMSTKLIRQQAMAHEVGFSLSYLLKGVK